MYFDLVFLAESASEMMSQMRSTPLQNLSREPTDEGLWNITSIEFTGDRVDALFLKHFAVFDTEYLILKPLMSQSQLKSSAFLVC